jgi:hypothetical protein
MGPGHLGIGLALKPVASKVPLWALLVATEVLDLLSFGFMALGIEKLGISQTSLQQGIVMVEPGVIHWSHGLVMALVWAFVASWVVFFIIRDLRSSVLVALAVFSHWMLDFIVHLPDLPLAFASSRQVGLGLWGSGPGLVISGILELVLLGGGLTIYLVYHRKQKAAQVEDALVE